MTATRFAPLNRSGGHPACRRGRASCRPELPPQWVASLKFYHANSAGLEAPALRQAGCPPLRGSWACDFPILFAHCPPPHEPKGRAGCPHPAATVQSAQLARRRGEDTQPYLTLAVQGFKARIVSENSHPDPPPSAGGEGIRSPQSPGCCQNVRTAIFPPGLSCRRV